MSEQDIESQGTGDAAQRIGQAPTTTGVNDPERSSRDTASGSGSQPGDGDVGRTPAGRAVFPRAAHDAGVPMSEPDRPAVLRAAAARGVAAGLVGVAVRLSFDQTMENVTGVGAPPPTWPMREQVRDVGHTRRCTRW